MDPPDRKGKRDSPSYSRPRGILKKDRTQRRRSLTWDEENLSLNEAQKTPKMKISEPKTPYHHDSGYIVDDESMEEAGRRSPPEMHQNLMSKWDEVVHKMEQVQAKQQRMPSSPKVSPHSSTNNLKDVIPTAASPIAAREPIEQSPKRDEDQRDRRNSRASESDSESDSASERKKKVFAERRKAHYNEFQVLKKIGKDLHFEEEEDAQLAVALAESAAAAAAHHHANKRTPAAATPTSVPCPSPGRVDEHMSDP